MKGAPPSERSLITASTMDMVVYEEFAQCKLMTQKTTADIVKEELHKAIFATQEFQDGKPEDSFVQGFQQVDKIVVDKANAEGWMNGTTAVGEY